MNRVLKTLVQSLVFLAIVMSPVTVVAVQIPNDFESIADALEDELVPQDEGDSQQGVANFRSESGSQQASAQTDTDEFVTSTISASRAESMSVAVAESIGRAELTRPVEALSPLTPVSQESFFSPADWHKKVPMSFVSNSPTVSLGSASSLCCDITGDGDISSLMVFAQPRPFASVEEVGSLTQFVDSSAGFSRSLTASGRQSEPGRATGRSRVDANSAGARGSATANRSPTTLSGVSSGACGCVGSACGSEPSSNVITAVFRMVTQFANCLFSSD